MRVLSRPAVNRPYPSEFRFAVHDFTSFRGAFVLSCIRSRSFRLASLAQRHSGAFQYAKVPFQKSPEPLQLAICTPASFHFLCEISMTKLYVGNLPFTATEEAVR